MNQAEMLQSQLRAIPLKGPGKDWKVRWVVEDRPISRTGFEAYARLTAQVPGRQEELFCNRKVDGSYLNLYDKRLAKAGMSLIAWFPVAEALSRDMEAEVHDYLQAESGHG
jgi:hypothetical protein